MKRSIALFAFAVLVWCGSAVTVKTFTPASGEEFSPGVGGRLVQASAYSPTQEGGSFALSVVYSAPVYTNATLVTEMTNTTYSTIYSNTVTHAVFTNVVAVLPPPIQVYCSVVGLSTNEVVTATTNVVSALKEVVSTNVTLVSGTATGKIYTGTPASGTYLDGFDTLVFSGTSATNGWLRLVLE